MREREIHGRTATAEPERREASLATDGQVGGRDSETSREPRDGESADRDARGGIVAGGRKRGDGRAERPGRIADTTRHRVHVLGIRAHVIRKSRSPTATPSRPRPSRRTTKRDGAKIVRGSSFRAALYALSFAAQMSHRSRSSSTLTAISVRSVSSKTRASKRG